MNTAQSTAPYSVAAGSKRGKNADFSLVFSASKIRTTPGDIGRYGRQPRCGYAAHGIIACMPTLGLCRVHLTALLTAPPSERSSPCESPVVFGIILLSFPW